MKTWYAVYTQPRNEQRAQEHLVRQGFDVFLPRYLKRRSHARKIEMVPAPLFPRYLFIAFDATDMHWRAVRSTRGVIDIVRNGVDPVPVPEPVIDSIKNRQDPDGFVTLARQAPFKRGAKIRIDVGPFAESEAIFESMRAEDRVVALLSLMGRKVVVQLGIRDVAPA